MPASNSLLDLLAALPLESSHHHPRRPSLLLPAPSRSASVSSATTITGTTPLPPQPASLRMPPSPTLRNHARIFAQAATGREPPHAAFMAPASPLVILSPNAKSSESNDPPPSASPTKQPLQSRSQPSRTRRYSCHLSAQLCQQRFGPQAPSALFRIRLACHFLASQAKRTAAPHGQGYGNSICPGTAPAPAASPSVKTPFDFVSPFDMLSSNDDQSADTTPQPSEAQRTRAMPQPRSLLPHPWQATRRPRPASPGSRKAFRLGCAE